MNKMQNKQITKDWILLRFPKLKVTATSSNSLLVQNPDFPNVNLDLRLPYEDFLPEGMLVYPGVRYNFTTHETRELGEIHQFSMWSDAEEPTSEINHLTWDTWVLNSLESLDNLSKVKTHESKI